MTHFHMTYDGTSYAPAILSCRLELAARDGAWSGQIPDDNVDLHLSMRGEAFVHAVSDDPDEHMALDPGVDTQWLTLPLSIFAGRDARSLDGVSIVYDGPGTINPLTGQSWREPPGLLGTYSNEAFRRVRIDITHREGSRFALHLAGETETGTAFDIACDAPLGASLVSSTGQAGEDRLRQWFDTFLRWDDFTWDRTVYQRAGDLPQHDLKGAWIA